MIDCGRQFRSLARLKVMHGLFFMTARKMRSMTSREFAAAILALASHMISGEVIFLCKIYHICILHTKIYCQTPILSLMRLLITRGSQRLPEYKTNLKVQRDTVTEAWCERFSKEVQQRGFIGASASSNQPTRKLSNLIRFLRNQPLKPYPYTIL